ncbi:MAG: hypothetical protein O3A82_12660 [Verrucomicrobia bacterium]|nr:hypothetical protein [Verrucomicrobiota bacterium]
MPTTLSLRGAQRCGNPATAQGNSRIRPRLDCHVSSLRDLPRNDNFGGCARNTGMKHHAHNIVIARSAATWQSSDRAGQLPHPPPPLHTVKKRVR